jgi:hypothetical protein
MAGYAARKWVHEYARKHSTFPHCEDRYGETRIERGDVADDTFKFFLDDDVKEGIMQSYQERIGRMFSSPAPPPNLEPIYVIIPVGGKIYLDHSTEEGRKAWMNAHPVERFIEKDTPNIFLIRRTPEYIAEVEKIAKEPQKVE